MNIREVALTRSAKSAVEQNPRHGESNASACSGADDTSLSVRAQAGDPEAFETLVQRYRGLVFRSAVALTGSSRHAKTVLLDTFTYAYRHLSELRAGGPCREWLMGITIRTTQQVIGAKLDDDAPGTPSLPPRTCPAWPAAATAHITREQMDAIVQAAVRSLPFGQRCVFVLRDVAGFPAARVAAILDLDEQLVRRRLLLARLRVREELASHLAEPGGMKPMLRMLVWMIYGMMTGRMVRRPGSGKDLAQ